MYGEHPLDDMRIYLKIHTRFNFHASHAVAMRLASALIIVSMTILSVFYSIFYEDTCEFLVIYCANKTTPTRLPSSF